MAIYFDPREAALDSSMVMIDKPQVCDFLRRSMNLTLQDRQMQTPFIFGSFTNNWSRKVRMLDARVFAMLSVCEKEKVMVDLKEARRVKQRLVNLVETMPLQREGIVDKALQVGLDFDAKLKGW